MPRRVYLPLNTPAFTGHTTVHDPLESHGSRCSTVALNGFACPWAPPVSSWPVAKVELRRPSLQPHYSAFDASTDPSATLSSSADFPGLPVIRPTLLRRFLAGTRRVSPVAQHVLVTVLSLPPRRGEQPYRSVFGWSFCLRPTVAGSTLGDFHFRGHNAFTVVTAR